MIIGYNTFHCIIITSIILVILITYSARTPEHLPFASKYPAWEKQGPSIHTYMLLSMHTSNNLPIDKYIHLSIHHHLHHHHLHHFHHYLQNDNRFVSFDVDIMIIKLKLCLFQGYVSFQSSLNLLLSGMDGRVTYRSGIICYHEEQPSS